MHWPCYVSHLPKDATVLVPPVQTLDGTAEGWEVQSAACLVPESLLNLSLGQHVRASHRDPLDDGIGSGLHGNNSS